MGLGWRSIALAEIALAARGHDVEPCVVTATGQRQYVVARQRLSITEVRPVATAILTTVFVAGEQESVSNLAAKAVRDLNEPDKPDHNGSRKTRGFRSVEARLVNFESLCLTIDDEPERPPHWQDRKWLKRGIQC